MRKDYSQLLYLTFLSKAKLLYLLHSEFLDLKWYLCKSIHYLILGSLEISHYIEKLDYIQKNYLYFLCIDQERKQLLIFFALSLTV